MDLFSKLSSLKEKSLRVGGISFEDALQLYEIGKIKPYLLMVQAREITEHFKGNKISLCSIVNAKSGLCPENCKFCAQSVHNRTNVDVYPLISRGEMVKKAEEARESGSHFFGIVTSGTEIDTEEEWREIETAVAEIGKRGIKPCCSLGLLNEEKAVRLKNAGLYRYHHNLETARSFFSNICTTHDYEEDIKTIMCAKKAGLSTCCGGIIGLGETMEQRLELAFTIKGLDVDSVPINILNPIEGTPLASMQPLHPIEILITISLFRFILPDKDIKLCGGKERNLRQLLPFGILAGCNSLMTGNYLTTTGRDTALDMEMIRDMGMEPYCL
ncbi:MAG: biotin synthase BioB [Syntrophorhabdaceae bacterium]|nr:biotin synthase BioB [Syntrophorhabdaceae bacterium]